MKKENSIVGQSYTDFKENRRIQMVTIGVLAVTVLILATMLINKKEIVIVTPPTFLNELRIGEDEANQEYQKRFAYNIALLAGNVDKQNVEFVTDALGKMLSPYLRAELTPQIENEARVLDLRDVKQTFMVDDMAYSHQKDIVFVWGTKTLTKEGSIPDKQTFTYEIQVKPSDGFPQVRHFKAYKGAPSNASMKGRDEAGKVEPQIFTNETLDAIEGITAEATK